MIKDKKALLHYLECDKIALGKKYKHPRLFGDEIWKFQICMRKLEYYSNIGVSGILHKVFYRIKYHKLSLKLGFSIPYKNIGPGLAIVHYGTIVISSDCNIGNNCRIHTGVNIGASGGEYGAATIGDNVYIGPGVKIIGKITIGDDSVLGANAVVTKNVPNGVTVGGIPAKIISENNSSKHLIKATEIIENEGMKK